MKNTIIILIIFGSIFSGCFKDEIPLELNEGANVRIVVDAWLTDLDEQQFITLEKTTDYLKQETAPKVSNAQVLVRYSQETITFDLIEEGIYGAPPDWRLEMGIEYELEVIHDGVSYKAKAKMREKPIVSNIRLEQSPDDDVFAEEIYFDLRDRAGEGDGYFGREFSSRGSDKKIIDEGGWITDDFLDGHLLADLSMGNAYVGTEAVMLEVHSLGKKAVDFFTQLDEVRYREGLFDPPPFDIPTNLSNGAVGFFVVSAVFQQEVYIDN